ncbi:MAG: complex I subunit 5 family protein [Thermoplasmatota archaeon]
MIPDPVLLIVIPLLAAFLIPLTAIFSKKLASTIPLLGLIGMAAVAGWLFPNLDDGAIMSETGGFAPPWGISLVVTPLGGMLALGMILVAIFVIIPTTGKAERKSDLWFNGMGMMATAGAVGMVITGDLFNLFVFLEITSIAAVVLAALPREGDDSGFNWKGAATLAVISAVASFMVLAAIALLYGSTSTLNLADMASASGDIPSFTAGAVLILMIIGFGVESEIFPLNGWVPEVYRGSRWGTASIFSGIIGKAGLIALIRVVLIIVGPSLGNSFASDLLLWGGLITYLVAEAAAFTSRDLYRLLGFSSIGVLGLSLAVISSGSEMGIKAGILLIIGNMIAKPILFSVIDHAGKGTKGDLPLSTLEGLIRRSPSAALLFTLSSLALLGMPPSPTFWGKFMLFAGADGTAGWAVAAAVVIGTLLEAGYIGRLVWKAVSTRETGREQKRIPMSVARIIPALIGILGLILIGLFPSMLGGSLDNAVKELSDPSTYIRWGGF